MIKRVLNKCAAKIRFNAEIVNIFPFRLGTRQGYQPFSRLTNLNIIDTRIG